MTSPPQPRCVVIVAGETSGDQHGAHLVEAMRAEAPDLFFCGIGGSAMAEAGVRLLVDSGALSVVGITEVLAKLPAILASRARIRRLLQGLRPDLLILLDFPDFNLPLAKVARRLGIPVMYYISPQIWAWRPGRMRQVKRSVDHMAVILPFEAEYYHRYGVPVTFVGHPLLDRHPPQTVLAPEAGDPANPLTIGLLPGSRDREVARHLPVMLDTATLLAERYPDCRFPVSVAPNLDPAMLAKVLEEHPTHRGVALTREPIGDLLNRCHVVVSASGTVTLQAAIHGTPTVIIYKVSPLTYTFGRLLIRVRHIGLANLILKDGVVPELIQDQARPANIAAVLADLIDRPGALAALRERLLGVRARLGTPGASRRAAAIALSLLPPLINQGPLPRTLSDPLAEPGAVVTREVSS